MTEIITTNSIEMLIAAEAKAEIVSPDAATELLTVDSINVEMLTITELLTEQVDSVELLEPTPAEQRIIEVAKQGPPGPTGPTGPQGIQGLQGPVGPAGDALPTSPSFTWLGGVLTGVSYPDGSSKSLTWATDRLEQIDFLRPSLAGVRKNLSYNPDGTLAAIAQSAI